jgi:D-alanyl-D-alanine carboxypeptidase
MLRAGIRGLLRFGAAVLPLALLLSCASSIGPFEPPPGGDGADLVLQEILTGQLLAQGALGIQLSMRVGERSFHLAVGDADDRRRIPLREDHVLRVGSVTKTFTAALILRLAESGALSLDDTIEGWFPLLPNSRRITIRSLLEHTSGVYDYTRERTFQLTTAMFSRKRWDPEELYRFVLRGTPDFAPGERYQYSNSNYLLLGIVAEGVTGRAYADLLQENVLGPAELEHTYVMPGEQVPAALITGYDRDILSGNLTRIRPGNRAWPSGAFAAGAVASTSGDLLRFIESLFYGQVLTSDSLDTMLAFLPAPDAQVPNQTGYGLGLRRLEIDGDVLVGHTGTIPGFGAAVFSCPEGDYSIAFAANLSLFDPAPLLRDLVRFARETDRP